MAKEWTCCQCGAEEVGVAEVCIYEQETNQFRDFCFKCGVKALRRRMLELSKQGKISAWHFTIPYLGKRSRNVAINYLAEVADY